MVLDNVTWLNEEILERHHHRNGERRGTMEIWGSTNFPKFIRAKPYSKEHDRWMLVPVMTKIPMRMSDKLEFYIKPANITVLCHYLVMSTDQSFILLLTNHDNKLLSFSVKYYGKDRWCLNLLSHLTNKTFHFVMWGLTYQQRLDQRAAALPAAQPDSKSAWADKLEASLSYLHSVICLWSLVTSRFG